MGGLSRGFQLLDIHRRSAHQNRRICEEEYGHVYGERIVRQLLRPGIVTYKDESRTEKSDLVLGRRQSTIPLHKPFPLWPQLLVPPKIDRISRQYSSPLGGAPRDSGRLRHLQYRALVHQSIRGHYIRTAGYYRFQVYEPE